MPTSLEMLRSGLRALRIWHAFQKAAPLSSPASLAAFSRPIISLPVWNRRNSAPVGTLFWLPPPLAPRACLAPCACLPAFAEANFFARQFCEYKDTLVVIAAAAAAAPLRRQ